MRKFLIAVAVVALSVSLAGCHKKQQSLEELQQPMAPEDLNRISSQTQQMSAPPQSGDMTASSPAPVDSSMAPLSPIGETRMEPLPPSGPFKPTEKEIQEALKNAGFYTGSVDGKIGPKTKNAIEAFQKANGLKADGKVGPKTWSALSKHLTLTAPSMPANPAAEGGSVSSTGSTGQ
ncbi:MAG: peptidoglycan-binding domain-containing protein [Candidatus Omnitrophica bacterium]|nr:peptidoglycan-binding domain-containing protein [Candidatus Omnitrophota bacterium]